VANAGLVAAIEAEEDEKNDENSSIAANGGERHPSETLLRRK
jgi:hypothetical protein